MSQQFPQILRSDFSCAVRVQLPKFNLQLVLRVEKNESREQTLTETEKDETEKDVWLEFEGGKKCIVCRPPTDRNIVLKLSTTECIVVLQDGSIFHCSGKLGDKTIDLSNMESTFITDFRKELKVGGMDLQELQLVRGLDSIDGWIPKFIQEKAATKMSSEKKDPTEKTPDGGEEFLETDNEVKGDPDMMKPSEVYSYAYQCIPCKKKFMQWATYIAHMAKHKGVKPFRCVRCGSRYSSQRMLQSHITNFHLNKKYPCYVCRKLMANQNCLRVHLKRHMGIKNHVCSYCGKSFVISTELKEHIRYRHTREKSFLCYKCGVKFVAAGELKSHEARDCSGSTEESGETTKPKKRSYRTYPAGTIPEGCARSAAGDKYVCAICNSSKEYATINQVRLHIARIHSSQFACKHCDMVFPSKAERLAHNQIHDDEKSHECEVCKKKFFTKAHLATHAIMHKELKEYKCEICQKEFAYKVNYKAHLLLHKDQKVYECKPCNVKYTLPVPFNPGSKDRVGVKSLPELKCVHCGCGLTVVRSISVIKDCLDLNQLTLLSGSVDVQKFFIDADAPDSS